MDVLIERSPDPKLLEKILPNKKTGKTRIPIDIWTNLTPLDMWNMGTNEKGAKEWRKLYTEAASTLFGRPDGTWKSYSYFKFTARRGDEILEFMLSTTPQESGIGNNLELIGDPVAVDLVPDVLRWLSDHAVNHYAKARAWLSSTFW